MHSELTNKQWQLLSAYLDDQLKDNEKRQVEELLQQNEGAKEALAALRRTRTVLRAMPMRKSPRNFVLSSEEAKKPVLPAFIAILRFSSAMAALLLVAVLALDLTGFAAPPSASRVAEDAASEMLAMEAPAEGEEERPPIIFWAGPMPMMGAYGKGGGGDGIGGGAEGPGFGIGGGAPGPGYVPPIEPLPEEEPLDETELIQPTAEVFPKSEPLTGTGPILGVRPHEERGEIRLTEDQQLPDRRFELPVPLITIEIILAILLVVTAIPAWLLRRK